MIWLVWRRQRAAMLLAGALLVAVALLLLAIGRAGPPPPAAQGPTAIAIVVRLVLLLLPSVLGLILGAGLFGREMESGTHVFALTQNVGRARWWATGLLVTALPAATAVVAVTWLAEWALGPAGLWSPLGTPFFDGSGLLPVAHLLLAFSVAAATGLLARNALVAVAVTAGVMLVVQIGLPVVVREHYAPPLTTRGEVTVLDSAPLRASRELDTRYYTADGREDTRLLPPCLPGERVTCLRDQGIAQVEVTYQPASRYWPFQGIEAGLLAGLAVVAAAAGWWGLRRRVW